MSAGTIRACADLCCFVGDWSMNKRRLISINKGIINCNSVLRIF